jgi:hypothetical protein
MPDDILAMQNSRESRVRPQKNMETAARRTTIILDKEEREYIDYLVSSGKEAGIKPLISKLLDIYRNLMICDWRFPGEYYCGISRTAFVNVELLSLLIQQVPKEKWREVSRKMGAALKVCIETTLDLSAVTRDNWAGVFLRLRVQGFGEFYTKDRYLLAKTPFIGEPDILAGMLEGLLNVELDLKNTVPPLVFEVRRELSAATVR